MNSMSVADARHKKEIAAAAERRHSANLMAGLTTR
jgi:hypothetical protein